MARNVPALGVPVAIGVGGVLDFISGRVRRAPRWLRDLGLEWLFRLLVQPRRWRRQLALPRFALWALLATPGQRSRLVGVQGDARHGRCLRTLTQASIAVQATTWHRGAHANTARSQGSREIVDE
jgi:hypothetical protein